MVLRSKISSNVMPSAYTAGGVAYIAQRVRNETGWQATCVLNWNWFQKWDFTLTSEPTLMEVVASSMCASIVDRSMW